MATSQIGFDDDEVQVNGTSRPEKEFWERTQNELDQLEKDFPDSLTLNEQIEQSFISNHDDDTFQEFDTLSNKSNTKSDTDQKLPNKMGDFNAIKSEDKIQKEPESIRLWREKQIELIKKKDEEEQIKKKEMREQAQKELDEWESMFTRQLQKTKEANRLHEKELQTIHEADKTKLSDADKSKKQLVTSTSGTNASICADKGDWDRVASMCDFNPKHSKHLKDVSRFRSVIVKSKSFSSSNNNTTNAKNIKANKANTTMLKNPNKNLPNGGPVNMNGELSDSDKEN